MSESNVHNIMGLNKSSAQSVDFPAVQDHTDFSNGNGGGGDMDRRIQKLEENVAQIKTDIAVIRSTGATEVTLHKEIGDIRKEMNNQTKWIAGAIFAALTIGLAVAKVLFH
ncbi:hypothetical protein YX24_09520 [Salmonella enterica subsp. enterica serovar Montevideo]|nr:hypothetical protein [Salmonella enterica subsp. enterica serovar Montevideo]ECO0713383.1 hypothetical protein [Salmonella enterica subsp. enterica serovar Montevideo]